MKVKSYTPAMIGKIMNDTDYAEFVRLYEKGKRLGNIINTTKGNYAKDATRGARNVFLAKRRLLKKYGINAE